MIEDASPGVVMSEELGVRTVRLLAYYPPNFPPGRDRRTIHYRLDGFSNDELGVIAANSFDEFDRAGAIAAFRAIVSDLASRRPI